MTLREDDPMLKNVLGIADAMDRLVANALRAPGSRPSDHANLRCRGGSRFDPFRCPENDNDR